MNNKKTTRQYIIEWVAVPLVGGTVIAIFTCMNCWMEQRWTDFVEDALISAVFWSILANGNGVLVDQLDKRISWIEAPLKRFIYSLITLLVFTVLASLLVIYLYVEFYFHVEFGKVIEAQGLWSLIRFPLAITLVISVSMHGRAFLLSWRREAINVEKLKTENALAKLESLQNQVNPHFLFNSLNSLTSLVYSDPDKAVDFIHKLSEVYRYVLDHQFDELVDIEQELELARSFVFLHKIRHGSNLKVSFNENGASLSGKQIPPLTLQILLENCFKHNEVSKENNLDVQVNIQEDQIEIMNNLNPVLTPKENSKGLGLQNIKSRYEYLSNEKVEISESDDSFSVIVPLLKISGE